jgi:hypothetical protein
MHIDGVNGRIGFNILGGKSDGARVVKQFAVNQFCNAYG